MGTTTNGLPWPEPTDRIVDGDDAIKALAVAVDAKIYAPAYGVSLGHTVAQTIPHNTPTALIFDTEYFDSHGFHSTGSRITIPAGHGGRYLVNYYFAFFAVAGGNSRQGWVRRNGSASDRIAPSLGFGSASYNGQLDGTTILDLIDGDYIEAMAHHDQGAAQPVQGNNSAAHIVEFSAIRLFA